MALKGRTMADVTYDEKAFCVGNHKVWIVSGAVHYFRVPRNLWRDRLLKLKRAGCNTVETYVAWNVHEPREGHFDFSGDADLDAFLCLAEELGLWIIVRPGPYICAEWDNGGLPAWLNAKEGIRLRVANDVYHRYIARWFDWLIPIVTRHQATRGGRVVLVQDENEYCFRNRPGGREHLEFLRDLMRELGIEVPIVVCNFFYERIADTIECWNTWNEPGKAIRTLRNAQPDTPNLITEFWCGWFDTWGHKKAAAKRAREVHSRSLEILANGGMYSYYMFHGGTNFAHYPGRSEGSDHVFMTTSYDYGAPLSQAGALTEKYYAAKLASVLASNLEAFFAESEPAKLAVRSSDDVEIVTRKGPRGHIIFVFNRSGKKRAVLNLPGGVSLEVSFRDLDAVALPYRFSPVAGFTIDYSNLSILGMMPLGVGRLVFLHAPRGTAAVLSAQGRPFRRKVTADAQVWFGNFPNLVAVLDTHRAGRTWFLPDRTVVGGDFIGAAENENVAAHCQSEGESVVTYFPTGKVAYAACRRLEAPGKPPRLGRWEKTPLLPDGKPRAARRVDAGGGAFKPLESIGYTGGYGWYYTRIDAEAAGVEKLLFTGAEDRLSVFVNGRRTGTFGRGKGASMGFIECPLKKGANDLHILLDNLGRANFSLALGEMKGIRSGVYRAARRLAGRFTWPAGRYDRELADAWQVETFWPKAKGIAATVAVVADLCDGEELLVRLQGIAEPAAVFVNGEFHSYYWGKQDLHKMDLVLPVGDIEPGRNLVELAFLVKPSRSVTRGISLYAVNEADALKGPWYFAALRAPKARNTGKRVARETPVAWETTFNLKNPVAPVFLVTEGLRKGEVWLNGRMAGRHWDIGPYHRTYLPEPWFKGKNTLVIVDEFGTRPSKVRLEYDADALMPYKAV